MDWEPEFPWNSRQPRLRIGSASKSGGRERCPFVWVEVALFVEEACLVQELLEGKIHCEVLARCMSDQALWVEGGYGSTIRGAQSFRVLLPDFHSSQIPVRLAPVGC